VSKWLGLAAYFLSSALLNSASFAAPEIGRAVWVKNGAGLETGTTKRSLSKGDPVHQDEVIVSGDSAVVEVQLYDQTKLAIGPDARIVLRKSMQGDAAPITVNLTRGAFRFITSIAPKSAYQIKTPAASLGVQGAVLDVYAADGGGTAILVHEGKVTICNLARSCTEFSQAHQVIFVSPDGAISVHPHWDVSLVPGVNAATAFPFAGQRLVIDPVQRWSLSELEASPAEGAPENPSPQQGEKLVRLVNVSGEVLVNSGQGFSRVTGETEVGPGDRVRAVAGSANIVYPNGTVVPVQNGEAVLVQSDAPASTPWFAGEAEPLLIVGAVAAGAAGIIETTSHKSQPASP